MRLLLVEDDDNSAFLLKKGLREQAYVVDRVADGQTALFQASTTDYDAIILDVMLPGRDGFFVCRAIRASGGVTPILMLTARDAVETRVEGLDAGADDYLVKPFEFSELLARLRALIRRGHRPLVPERLSIGFLTLEPRSRRVYLRNRLIELTRKEYALLEYLARRAGEVVSRTDISENVWGDHYDLASNVVDVHVQRLRRKLDQVGEDSLIKTWRGEGYQLAAAKS